MSVEQATFISQLNPNKPAQNELLSEGALHLTLIKKVLQDTFPQMNCQTNISSDKLNHLNTVVTSTSGDLTVGGVIAADSGSFTNATVSAAPASPTAVINKNYADTTFATKAELVAGTAGVSKLTVGTDDVVVATTGATTVNGTLTTTGETTINGKSNLKGAVTANAGLTVTNGTTTLQNTNTQALTAISGKITGDLTVTGTINRTSDERLKTNIIDLQDSIDEIYPTRYEKDGRTEFGVIAQEVAEVFPEMVSTCDDGYLAVDYIQFIPILIKEVKELKKRISELGG